MQDLSLFLGQMIRRPARVVALAPSSRFLARAMVAHVDPAAGPVAELGPGTGVITRALLTRGVRPEDLTLYELDAQFATHLRRSHPDLTVLERGAQTLGHDEGTLGAVVSGLPLLSMGLTTQRAILCGAFARLRPGGAFIQFTYGAAPPVPSSLRQEIGLSHWRSQRIWANLPPARVYVFRRRDEV